MRRALLLLALVLPSLLWAKPRVTQTKFTSRKVPVHVVSCSLSNGFSAVALIQPAPSGVPGASSVCADPLESARKAGLVAAVNAQIIASQMLDGPIASDIAVLEDFAKIINGLIQDYRTTAKQSGPDKKKDADDTEDADSKP